MNIKNVPNEILEQITGFKILSVIETKDDVTFVEDFQQTPNSKVFTKKDFWKKYRETTREE